MSDCFDIDSSIKAYTVRIGAGITQEHLADNPNQIIVCDRFFADRYKELNFQLIDIPAVESEKDLSQMGGIIGQLRAMGAHRGTVIHAIGGGVIQDIATFAASVYMRGIKWNYSPTTLLGMVDSCIGGKSSINVGQYKNLVGNFYPPESVLVDTRFCDSLHKTQKIEGLCEAVKICFASADGAFASYLDIVGSGDVFDENALLGRVISLSLKTKKWFIEEDEFDDGIRQLLNFGHTFGHALEGASDFRISHGIAVGLGMLASMNFSESLGLVGNDNKRASKLRQHVRWLLGQVPDLPGLLPLATPEKAIDRFASDKKHNKDHYAVIAVSANGHLVRHLLPRTPAGDRCIFDAFASLHRELNEIQ